MDHSGQSAPFSLATTGWVCIRRRRLDDEHLRSRFSSLRLFVCKISFAKRSPSPEKQGRKTAARRDYIANLRDRKDTVARVVRQTLVVLASESIDSVGKRRAQDILLDLQALSSITSAVWKALSGPGVSPTRAKDPLSIRNKLIQICPGMHIITTSLLQTHTHIHRIEEDDSRRPQNGRFRHCRLCL